MTNWRNIYTGCKITACAAFVSLPANLCAARLPCLNLNHIVARGDNLTKGGIIAFRAGNVGLPAVLGTGSRLSFMGDLVVTESRNLLVCGVITSCTALVSLPTDLGTIGILCLMLGFIVTESRNLLGLCLSAGAKNNSVATFLAGRLLSLAKLLVAVSVLLSGILGPGLRGI